MDAPAREPFETLAAFGPLTWAEQAICIAAVAGVTAKPPRLDTPIDHPELRVRAELVRFLAIEREAGRRVHERGFGLRRMRVVGELDLSGCEVRRPLRFVECELADIDIVGAKLSTLTFRGGWADKIDGDRCSAGALFLREFTVRQGVRLLGAHISGDLDCEGSRLTALRPASAGLADSTARNAALSLDGATIAGAVFLRGTRFMGSVVAHSLTVGKLFDARGCLLSSGQMTLACATFGGHVQLGGAVLSTPVPFPASPYGAALVFAQARIGGSLLLSDRFQADGLVDLSDARIAGNLSLRGARFVGPGDFAVNAQRLQVEGTFDLDSTTCFGREAAARADAHEAQASAAPTAGPGSGRELAVAAGAALDLTAASVGSLSDQWAHWPRGNRVLGFRYKEIVGATSTRAAWWVDWLKLQVDEDLGDSTTAAPALGVAGFKPQPWDQAILALRAAGCLRDAEDVAIAKETAEHAFETGPKHWAHRLWGWCVGYGYRPLRLLWALPVVYVVSGFVYAEAARQGVMAPTREEFLAKAEYRHCRPEAGGNWTTCALAPAHPDFYPWANALEMMLPAVELRQSKDWAPVPWQRRLVAAKSAAAATERVETPHPSAFGTFTLVWSWIESTLGLGAPLLLGLALSGLLRRKLRD